MNMKKTLAGLMAGVVAISAMATVAVSAKAQEAKDVTWSTMYDKTSNATTNVYITLTKAQWDTAFGAGTPAKLTLKGDAEVGTNLKINKVKSVTFRQDGQNSVIDEDLSRFFTLKDEKDALNANDLEIIAACPDGSAMIEICLEVECTNGKSIKKNSITNEGSASTGVTNVKKDASEGKEGILLNHTENWVTDNGDDDDDDNDVNETAVGNAEIERKDTVYVKDLGRTISLKFEGAEPVEEIADLLKDSKNATIEFIFDKASIDDSVSDKTFANWVDRYDWNADEMKSAISLRINNSNVLSVDMMEFDKTNFTAIYSWDEVMAKFQVGSVTGLVNQMGLKINNEKLPAKKDPSKEVIDLRLNGIRVVIPEIAETNDDTMVEDFAAGESATVVEDTLPAATDAPAADAPAATDAPATTDAASNPETGNSAVALLAIPAALAAAAIVAKKRG